MNKGINGMIIFLGILLLIFGWLGTKTFLSKFSWIVIIFGIIAILKGIFSLKSDSDSNQIKSIYKENTQEESEEEENDEEDNSDDGEDEEDEEETNDADSNNSDDEDDEEEHCSECGGKIKVGSKFCKKCGAKQ